VLKLQQSELIKLLSNLKLHWPKSQTVQPNQSTQSKEQDLQVWSQSKYVWGSNHQLEDRPVRSLKTRQKSPLIIIPLFSHGCGILVCSLTISQQQPRSWLALACLTHSHQGWQGFSPYTSSRRHLSRWMQTTSNSWYVLDFLGWCWAANTPPSRETWPSKTNPHRLIGVTITPSFLAHTRYTSNHAPLIVTPFVPLYK
jgi:hypothetical protein